MATQIKAMVTINVPEDQVVVEKSYIEGLEDYKRRTSLEGRYWTMADLIKRVGHGRKWILNNIIRPFYDELNFENGGPAFIPINSSQQYSFNAQEMATFLSCHFPDIYKHADEAVDEAIKERKQSV
jgi:phage pi2 protein 07